MSIFRKKKTQTDPYKRREEAQNRLDELCSERDDLDKHHRWDDDYDEQRNILTRGIAAAISDKKLAEDEIRQPKPVPHTVIDNHSRVFAPKIGVKVGSENKKGLIVDSGNNNGNYNGNNYVKKSSAKSAKNSRRQASTESAEPAKHSKIKTAFAIIGLAVLIGALTFGVVFLSTCLNAKKGAQSTAAAIFASTSE